MGAEYIKARSLACLRAFPETQAFIDTREFNHQDTEKIKRPMSAPPSPRLSPMPKDFPEDEDDGE